MNICVAGVKEKHVPELRAKLNEPSLSFVKDAASVPPDTEVLYSWLYGKGAIAIDHLPALKWIHQAGAGVDAVLTPSIVASDVVMTNSAGVFDDPIAEFVLGQILIMVKRFDVGFRQQAERAWRHYMNGRIAGKSVLVVGAGSIGRSIHRVLTSVGMDVSMMGRSARSDGTLGVIHGPEDLLVLASGHDVLVIATPLTPETTGMIDGSVLDAMPATSYLVNIGRGKIVDTNALVHALNTGSISGAALDVVDPEPLPENHPLWEAPGVVLTPHNAGDYPEHRQSLVDVFIDNVERYRRGDQLLNLIDKIAGY